MKSRTILEVITALLTVLFLYAASTQLISYNTFYGQLNRFFSNNLLTGFISVALPVLQVLLAILLWRPATRLLALGCTLAAVSLFTVYLIMMLPSAYRSSCRCGELLPMATLEVNIIINLFIVVLSATTIILMGRLKTNTPDFS
jgi:hypothetical protein